MARSVSAGGGEGEAALRAAGLGSKAELLELLTREDTCRQSEATQAAYADAEAPGSDTDWLEVTAAMQERVLRESGVPQARMAAALWLLRSAHALWPEDARFRQVSCWVRHNRARDGALTPGCPAPDLRLHPIEIEWEIEREIERCASSAAGVFSATGASSAAGASAGVAAVTSVRRVCAGKPTLLVAGSFT